MEGKVEMVIKLLHSRFPSMPDTIMERVGTLSPDQLDDLAISFVLITGLPDLDRWLANREDQARTDPSKWPR